MSSASSLEAKGLFSGLFDFSFTTFITLKFLRVIYILLLVLILVAGFGFLVSSLSEGGTAAVVGIILVPLVTLLYVIFARIYMELIALFFRIGENTTLLVQQGGGSAPAGPPAGYGGPPGPPSYGSGPGGSSVS